MYQYPVSTLILTLLLVIKFIINTDAHGSNLVDFQIWPQFFQIDTLPLATLPRNIFGCKLNLDKT